jgi:transposase
MNWPLCTRNFFALCSLRGNGSVFVSMADSDRKPIFGNRAAAAPAEARVRAVNRKQWLMLSIDVERLIPDDHAARAIWELVGRLDLRPFYEKVKAVEGRAGQPAFDPRLMISLWVYGISRGISSARELSEWCDWEPGLQWLCAMGSVNYHSLSTFRVANGEALKKLFVELLGVLSAQGLVELERLAVDGTRIRAHCSDESFRQGKKLQEYLERAAAQVEAIEQEPEEAISRRQQAARERSRRERAQRVAAAREQLSQLQQERGPSEAAKVQVSASEADARIMKQSGGGFAPGYNLQLATDDKAKIIVAAVVSNSGTDTQLLAEVMDEVQQISGAVPNQVLVDGGYVSADNIGKMHERGVELVGPVADVAAMVNKQAQQRGISEAYLREAFRYDSDKDTYQCPQGNVLVHIKQRLRQGGRIEHEYRAKRSDCASCPHKMECCPQAITCGRTIVRSEPAPILQTFREKMQTEAYRQLYRKRSEVAEFPNAWLKEKLRLRRFRLRGITKVTIESFWAALTYNVQQWIRLAWRTPLVPVGV